jgi:predicted dehydrogenase
MLRSPFLPLDYLPKIPAKSDYKIGVIGAGQIVNQAHLPAYRKAGFQIVAITDERPDAARETADRFAVPLVCRNVEELLATPEIDIVDIAVPARSNPLLSRQALRAGKHVLVQKPMAETSKEAEAMVQEASSCGRKLAVNQQMRWSPSVRAAANLLQSGFFGELLEASIQIQIRTGWDAWPWLKDHPYPEIYYHSIHHVDTLRYWLGDPASLYATLAHSPGCSYAGPTRNYMLFEYPGNLRASLLVNHHSVAPNDDLVSKFTMEGTEGRCEGTIGLLLNYPLGRSDLLQISHRELTPNGALRLELSGRWFPDAFIGPMSSLMEAISIDSEPETSGSEVYATMRLVEAICRSHETKQSVTIQAHD